MASNSINRYTVQEATNIGLVPRVVDVSCTTTAADYDENDVIFNWTEVSNISRYKGAAIELISASALLPAAMGDQKGTVQLIFARGIGDLGTTPAALGTLDAAVSITRANAQAAQICGSCLIGGEEDDLVLANISSNEQGGLRLILAPSPGSTCLWVAGVAREEPAAAFTDTTIDLYLGIYG